MCTNKREIVNPYTHRRLFVDCGKCPSCLQAKADRRTLRIKNSLGIGEVALFVNLDYRNDCVPYIRLSDMEKVRNFKSTTLRVYRDSDSRLVRYSSLYDTRLRRVHNTYILNEFRILDPSLLRGSFTTLSRGSKDKIGVIHYADIQNFIKRLRINLKRHYNYADYFKFFSCAEYGGKTCRPHFHLLVFIPQRFVETFRYAIAESWPFADTSRTLQNIEIARNAAAYVSSYVNSSRHVPTLFRDSQFGLHQRHTYSHEFGVERNSYALQAVVKEYVEKRNIRRDCAFLRDGTLVISSLLLPKYIVNRHFPKFKGFSRLSSSEIYDCVLRPAKLAKLRERLEIATDLDGAKTFRQIVVMLRNKLRKCDKLGINKYDFAWTYANIYSTYNSELMKDMYASQNIRNIRSIIECYDNIRDVKNYPYLIDIDVSGYNLDCNKFRNNVINTRRLSLKYDNYSKDKDVRQHIYTNLNF